MKYLEYNERGELVGCYEVVPVEALDRVLQVTSEEADTVLRNPGAYRVREGVLVSELPPVPKEVLRVGPSDFAPGVVIDGVCYATSQEALSFLAVQSGKTKKAITHTEYGDNLVDVDSKTVSKIVEALTEKLNKNLNIL